MEQSALLTGRVLVLANTLSESTVLQEVVGESIRGLQVMHELEEGLVPGVI